tara:strand:+ start:126 stop:365 length:240 start_codon:yes stop_codon:yes gene_type:complete
MIYPVINSTTGERKDIKLSSDEIMQWYEENPDWKRDWSEGCAGLGEIGEWKDTLIKKNPGWNEVLAKASKQPGANVKPI